MFQTLTKKLNDVLEKIRGRGALTEEQIDESMRDIRKALLEADVALPAAKDFIAQVKERAKGQEVIKSVSPGQMVVKIINDELIKFLSPNEDEGKLNLNSTPPANILFVGLQGSGKTSASSKLALRLKNQGKKVLLVSLDTYRPAAQDQLEILAKSIEVDSLPIIKEQMPLEITKRAMTSAKLGGYDVVIYDTAGRLHIDDTMIDEVVSIKHMLSPIETLLVVDAMMGQDAANTAKVFDDKLSISGVILSRIDGDARGGAALSVRYITGKPIKFLSTGEKPSEFIEFDAKRIAGRILDMGDVVGFVEKASEMIDKQEAEVMAKKLQKGKFDLSDYISQLRMIKKLGGISGVMGMLPGMNKISDKISSDKFNEKILSHQEAIYFSMTKKERRDPDIINASRKKRIAAGSGTSVQQVNSLLKQHMQISKLMKRAAKMDPKSLMRGGIGKLFS